MKIIYRDPNIVTDIEPLGREFNFGIERRDTIEEQIEEIKKEHKDIGIGSGGPLPESFIDLGKYLISFFLGAVVTGVTYDLIKIAIIKIIRQIRDKTKDKYKYFIVSDGEDPNNFDQNVYFFIPIDLPENELSLVLNKIQKIIEVIDNLKRETQIIGSLRFDYFSGQFILRDLSYSN